MGKFYITTPIYYVNDKAHIGHAYTTVIADTMARFKRLCGDDVLFLTGTDEHGQKIQEAAKKGGKTPKEYADGISKKFKDLWDGFGISYDRFIRTTDPQHEAGVQKAFAQMLSSGDIYKGEYEGHYCVSCETFFTQTQLVADKFCPDCGKEVGLLKEQSYFFRLSKYSERLLEFYRTHEDAILPRSRRNEVIRFIESGLNDLSITRTSFDWGIKLPSAANDQEHVIYVWLDALMNYLTALGYGGDEARIGYYPADFHVIGKDILRFHAIFWPAFLMSLNLPLPRHIAAHGWWVRDGEKMSKSKGNVIDPKEVADAYGLDNFRFFLLREVPFGADGDFGQKALIDRINNDLGNDLGNLLNRLLGMSEKYFALRVSSSALRQFYAQDLERIESHVKEALAQTADLAFNKYLEELWKILALANKKIADVAPWEKMKENRTDEVSGLLGLIANALVRVGLMLAPVMPQKSAELLSAFGLEATPDNFKKYIFDGELLQDLSLIKIAPLFPKIEAPLLETPKAPAPSQKRQDLISIDEFFQTVIKVGEIKEATEIPKSSKLLLLKVDIGESAPRQVVAGIREFYAPQDLIGTQVCLVANLKPAKLMGYESQGMVLAARDEHGLSLVRPQKPTAIGTQIK